MSVGIGKIQKIPPCMNRVIPRVQFSMCNRGLGRDEAGRSSHFIPPLAVMSALIL